MKIVYTVVISLLFALTAFGQTNWTGSVSADWNNDLNWTAGVPTTGVLATVLPSLNNPIISNNLTIDFTLQNLALITFDADIGNASTIINFGGALIVNNGLFTNNIGQFINNNGTIINNSQVNNSGTIQSNGSGVLENALTGIFTNAAGAGVNNFATILNGGTFTNDGSIANCNTIDNFGTFNNNGPLNQGANGIFNNLNNALFVNSGNIVNSGDINNNPGAVLDNNSNIQNNSDGVLINGGALNNEGAINNAGLFDNSGTLTNNDFFTNNFGANFINTSGDVLNGSCNTFQQFSANPISCFGACSFINNGVVYQIAGAGTVDITGGTGIVLNDINQQPAPTASCQNITLPLDEDGFATITPANIDNGSSAGYCGIENMQINISSFDCSNIGPNTVLLTVTDSIGVSSFCTAIVTIVDVTAPVLLDCPLDLTLTLDAGECDAIINFNPPSVEDECGATIAQTDNSGLSSGDAFPIGLTTIEYQATDGTSIVTCSFDILINEYPYPTSALTCNNFSQIALDQNCEAMVGADDILEGGPYGCYDDYIIELFYDFEMTNPVPTSPIVNSQHINDTLIVSVIDPETGNSCWGEIYVQDNIAPVITCEDLTISCLQDSHPDAVGYPASFDNCDNGLFPLFVDSISGGGCVDGVIARTWTVTDFSGNSSSCQQIITITRPDISEVEFPLNWDNIELPALDCSNDPDTHPNNTGWPEIQGVPIQINCNFGALYEDNIIPICEGTYKIIREWEVADWCTSEWLSHTQIIKVVDEEGPALTCPANIEISTAPNSCVAFVELPFPLIEDACSDHTSVSITASAGTINNGILTDLPPGVHTVSYWVTDDCGNESSCSITVSVADITPPVAICESAHNVSLTIDEPTLVPALVFDDGSYDNCSGLTYQVRRMDAPQCLGFDGTNFGDYVPFYCCDVTGVVMIELRVTDVGGQSNSCMVEVYVEDNLNPTIQCPPDVTLGCYEDYTDLALTGEPVASDNCDYTFSYFDNGSIDNCGGGEINRIWTATDPGGLTASCVQRIYVINDGPFYINDSECDNADPNDGVIWPCDYTTDDCAAGTDPDIAGEPQIFEDGCDLVAVTYQDIELPIIEDACTKIIRVWTVVDWCQYDATTGAGQWYYNQIIKVLNTEGPDFSSDCSDKSFCSYDDNCMIGNAQLLISATDDCTPDDLLNYNYEIDLDNDGSVDLSGSGNDASGNYSLGTHRIKWFAEDGCGNVNTCEYIFVIADCKLPTPYCINGLAVNLVPVVNMATVWATDFDLGSFDNCGISEFRIASPSGGPGQTSPPPAGANSVTFNCDDIGTQTVDMWVSDINGNWDYCSTYILIQDNLETCPEPGGAQISGTIANEQGDNLESVVVYLEGDIPPGIPDPNVTGVDGNYSFPELPVGYDYMVSPEKEEYPLNGVSTLDLVLMKRHVLGLQDLDSPYKMIAADINKSGSISTFDLVLLRRLILQIDLDFSSNSSWRFIDANYVFPDPNNPFASAFPEVLDIDELNENMQGDFVAVKVGDVNGNASTSDFVGEGDDRNMEDPMIFKVQDKVLNPGRMYQVDFTSEDISSVLGYQFTLNFDQTKLRFINLLPGEVSGMTTDNFGFSNLNEGVITTSWNQELNADQLDEGTVLFSLVFESQSPTLWSEALAISSKYTRAEAYRNTILELLNVILDFEQEDATTQAKQFKIYTNQPNPFIEETLVSFNLPEDTPLKFTIQDVSGRIIKMIDQEAVAGYNELVISKNDLKGPGLYYYTIKTKTHRVSQRMILTRE